MGAYLSDLRQKPGRRGQLEEPDVAGQVKHLEMNHVTRVGKDLQVKVGKTEGLDVVPVRRAVDRAPVVLAGRGRHAPPVVLHRLLLHPLEGAEGGELLCRDR